MHYYGFLKDYLPRYDSIKTKLVFRQTRQLESDTDVKVYSDLPKEISERRKKQWPKLKKAREEGKIGIFNKLDPENFFTNGQFVPLQIEHADFLGMIFLQIEHFYLMSVVVFCIGRIA